MQLFGATPSLLTLHSLLDWSFHSYNPAIGIELVVPDRVCLTTKNTSRALTGTCAWGAALLNKGSHVVDHVRKCGSYLRHFAGQDGQFYTRYSEDKESLLTVYDTSNLREPLHRC